MSSFWGMGQEVSGGGGGGGHATDAMDAKGARQEGSALMGYKKDRGAVGLDRGGVKEVMSLSRYGVGFVGMGVCVWRQQSTASPAKT